MLGIGEASCTELAATNGVDVVDSENFGTGDGCEEEIGAECSGTGGGFEKDADCACAGLGGLLCILFTLEKSPILNLTIFLFG